MFVDVKIYERTYIYLEFFIRTNISSQFLIQSMYAFDHYGLILTDRGYAFTENLFTGHEIEPGHVYFSALEQVVHVGVEKFYIKSVQIFVVILPVFVSG